MSEEQFRRPVERFYNEVVRHGHMNLIDELTSQNFVEINPYTGARRTAEDLARDIYSCRTSIPDFAIDIEGIDVRGNQAIATSTLQGEYHGGLIDEAILSRLGLHRVRETGSCHIALRFNDAFAIENGMITRHMSRLQGPGLLPQLIAGGLIVQEGSEGYRRSRGLDLGQFDTILPDDWQNVLGSMIGGYVGGAPRDFGIPATAPPSGYDRPVLGFDPLPGWPPITDPPGPIDDPDADYTWRW